MQKNSEAKSARPTGMQITSNPILLSQKAPTSSFRIHLRMFGRQRWPFRTEKPEARPSPPGFWPGPARPIFESVGLEVGIVRPDRARAGRAYAVRNFRAGLVRSKDRPKTARSARSWPDIVGMWVGKSHWLRRGMDRPG